MDFSWIFSCLTAFSGDFIVYNGPITSKTFMALPSWNLLEFSSVNLNLSSFLCAFFRSGLWWGGGGGLMQNSVLTANWQGSFFFFFLILYTCCSREFDKIQETVLRYFSVSCAAAAASAKEICVWPEFCRNIARTNS